MGFLKLNYSCLDRPASGYAQIVGADVSDSVAYDLVLSDGQKYVRISI